MELRIIDKNSVVIAFEKSENKVNLTYCNSYNDGDRIVLMTEEKSRYYIVRFEDSMNEALIYTKGDVVFEIPPKNSSNYSPKSFTGSVHYITARIASEDEIKSRKCLSFNPFDNHSSNFFPHAHANVETRNEAVFAARNAIDGIFANSSHGAYPYQSWGINRDRNAALTVDFGREVRVNEVRITLRADFPHDNYWERVRVEFSDGSSEELNTVKTAETQDFMIKERVTTYIVLKDLIMAAGESPFPALTQIEVFGEENN